MTAELVDGALRAKARARSRAIASPGDWLAMVVDQHDMIERAFEAAVRAESGIDRMRQLAVLGTTLNGHMLAEETVLYPVLVLDGHDSEAEQAYAEQTAVRIQMAELERTSPLADEWLAGLLAVRTAVLNHIYDEECRSLLALRQADEDHVALSKRYRQEFERYRSD